MQKLCHQSENELSQELTVDCRIYITNEKRKREWNGKEKLLMLLLFDGPASKKNFSFFILVYFYHSIVHSLFLSYVCSL
jgi:hypothetical protein